MQADWIIINVNLATMVDHPRQAYGLINDGLVAVHQGQISWVGKRRDAPHFSTSKQFNAQGGWLTPGLVDCHTHLMYAGHRTADFERRNQGQHYRNISHATGGGILNTVEATRNVTDAQLINSAEQRLHKLLQEGVTTVEIKSGYGLNLACELRQLRLARELGRRNPVNIQCTFLAAHALPLEFAGRADDYIAHVCTEILPAVVEHGLADAVDVYCETIGFSPAQCKKIWTTAQAFGLPIKGHVEQLSYYGGARLLGQLQGLSMDHCEYLPAAEVPMLKQQGLVAVLLPAAFYFLSETQRPPIAAMRAARLPMAVASDLNPGSAPMASLLLAMNQACVLFGLTAAEALAGSTRNAAMALGLGARKGQIKPGYDADLLLWDIAHPSELSYAINMHLPKKTWYGGQNV